MSTVGIKNEKASALPLYRDISLPRMAVVYQCLLLESDQDEVWMAGLEGAGEWMNKFDGDQHELNSGPFTAEIRRSLALIGPYWPTP